MQCARQLRLAARATPTFDNVRFRVKVLTLLGQNAEAKPKNCHTMTFALKQMSVGSDADGAANVGVVAVALAVAGGVAYHSAA